MEMEYFTEFPRTHMVLRPRKKDKLTWETPQHPLKAQLGLFCWQDVGNLTSYGPSRVLTDHANLCVKELNPKCSPPWNDDDKNGHYVFALGDNLTSRYKTHQKIGEGTFGQVLECWDREVKEMVAIKVFRSINKYLEAAMIEVEVLQLLGRYNRNGSRCVQIQNWFDYHNHICIMLGPSLYDFIRKNNYCPFPVDLVRDLCRQLLECVAFIHDLRLIHTDLKPENIFFISLEYVKVPDFKSTSRSPHDVHSIEDCLYQVPSRLLILVAELMSTKITTILSLQGIIVHLKLSLDLDGVSRAIYGVLAVSWWNYARVKHYFRLMRIWSTLP